MKKNILKINLLALVLLTLFSCENFIGGDINRDPDNPETVTVTAQTPAIQIAMADMTGGDFSRFNCMLVQQVEGVARQWSSFNQYTGLTPNRFNAAWEDTYASILVELQTAKINSVENGYAHYEAMVDIMTAYTLLQATDVWDDMPYTEALQGQGNTSPAYDTQASIYTAAFSQLDNAIALIGGDSGPIVPGSEDVIYGGNMTSWLLAAHAIKARAFLHQGNYASALTEAQAAFGSQADNMSFMYVAGQAGPWFRFNRDREGDIEFHPTMSALMTGLNDTLRLAVMSPTFHAGDHPYMVEAFDQQLVSYREVKFIEAESLLQTAGSATDIHSAYIEAIEASFNHLRPVMDQYFAENNVYYFPDPVANPNDSLLVNTDYAYSNYLSETSVDPGIGNVTLDHIITQKYIGLFLQPEVYSDWRRTNIPALTPVSGSAIPVRWHYSTDEYLFNSSSPTEAEVNIYTNRVGWNR